jgi:ketosteroid isomerase-like protein
MEGEMLSSTGNPSAGRLDRIKHKNISENKGEQGMITKRATCGAAILTAVLLTTGVNARAQTNADAAAVTAANNAFYSAVSALDAAAMEKVWSQEPYVASIGPRSKAIAMGSAEVQDSYKKDVMATLAQLTAKPVDTEVHVNGAVAWVVGKEMSEGKMKDGSAFGGTNFVTSVFEKKDGRWLMVSHHANRVPL